MNKTLEELRKEIDAVDDELIKMLSKRMEIVKEIGKLKKENNIKPLDEKRWQEIVESIKQKIKNLNLSEDLVQKIYEEIHQEALKIEKNYE